MDQALFKEIYKDTPKFNPIIASNISYEMMKNVEQVIVDAFLSSQHDYPDSLRFVGLERVDPKVEFKNGGWAKGEHDVTKNTIYMTRLNFEFEGKPLKPFYLYLPYCHKGGLMTIGGSSFGLSPVLIDPCLSVTDKNIYLSANKDKLTFNALPYHYFEDGERQNEQVVYSRIYRGGKKPPGHPYAGHRTRNMHSIMVHYLFSRHGVSGTFEKYLGVGSVVMGVDDIDEINYPPEEWVICSSLKIHPKASYSGNVYYPTKVNMAIRRSDMKDECRSLIAGFFYLADHFPARFNKATPEELDSGLFYQRLLALTILPHEQNEITAFSDMKRHLESLDSYIDESLRKKLLVIENMRVDDIYDLFANIVLTYHNRITVTIDQLTTMYNKRLVLLPYLLEDIIYNINKLGFDLQSAKRDDNFTAQKAEKKIAKRIKPLMIIGINSSKHRETAPINVATDNLIAKVSSPVIPQAKMSSQHGGNKKTDLSMVLSASIAEVGNITSTAGCATGRSRLNMFVHVDDTGNIIRNPELVEIIDRAQRAIQR